MGGVYVSIHLSICMAKNHWESRRLTTERDKEPSKECEEFSNFTAEGFCFALVEARGILPSGWYNNTKAMDTKTFLKDRKLQ